MRILLVVLGFGWLVACTTSGIPGTDKTDEVPADEADADADADTDSDTDVDTDTDSDTDDDWFDSGAAGDSGGAPVGDSGA